MSEHIDENGDVHVAARSVQVPGAEGRVLHINLGARQCRENGKATRNVARLTARGTVITDCS